MDLSPGTAASTHTHLLFGSPPVLVLVLGWFAAVVNSFFTMPQVVRVLRTRSIAGVSVPAWQIMLGANLGWTVHGVVAGYANLWLPNAFLLLCTSAILAVIKEKSATSWARLVLPGLGLATIMISLDLLVGPVAFALAAFAPSGIAQLMQLRVLVHRVNVSGISTTFLILSVATQLLWISWAALVGEPSVLLSATAMSILMGANLVWALLRRYRVVRPTLASF